jgi:hypothetical protein
MLPFLPADLKPPILDGGTGSMVFGGLLLAAFFIIAGIWFVRKKRRKQTLGLVLLLAAFCPRSRADIPPPPPQGTPLQLELKMDYAAAGGPVLRIPKKALGASHAQGFGAGAPQVIGGVFLSCAIVLGGIWLVRRRPRIAPAAAMGAASLLAVAISFVAGAMWAQDRPLRPTVGDLNGGVEPGQTRSGVVALQIVSGDSASLLFPPPRHRVGPPRK